MIEFAVRPPTIPIPSHKLLKLNLFPGFNYEVQGVFEERVDGRVTFHTYAVRE